MSEFIPLTFEKLEAMPMKEIFQLVFDMQTKGKEVMQDLQTINEFLASNTLGAKD